MADYTVDFTLEPQPAIDAELVLGDDTVVDANLSLDITNVDKTFVYEQAIASNSWTIEHYLGKKPSVTVVDSADNVIYPAVHYIDENSCVVTFNAATKGKAYLN